MAYRHFKGELREDPAKYLFKIPEEEEDEVQVLRMVEGGRPRDPDVHGASRAIQGVINESAMMLEDLKGNLKKFLEDHLDDFSGKIAQTLLMLGFANTEGLCTERMGRDLLRKLDEVAALLKNGRDGTKMDELAAQLNDLKERSPLGKAKMNPTVVGEISKNLGAINMKLDHILDEIGPLAAGLGEIGEINTKLDHILDAVGPLVTGLEEVQNRTKINEQEIEVTRNDFELLSYVTCVKQDENNFEFQHKIEELALVLRTGFKTLKESIPSSHYKGGNVEKQMRINAIWATINLALSKLCKLAILCPTGNEELDEQAAARWGITRDASNYEDFSDGLLASTLKDLADFSREQEGQVRFAPNIINDEVKMEVKMATTSKPRKSSLKLPAASYIRGSAKPSTSLQSTVQPRSAPDVELMDSAAACAPLPPSPPATPASRPYGNYALRAKFPGGIMKKEKMLE